MKVLDLFCGRGGWSRPFVEDGDEVDGVDIVDTRVYPGRLILSDIREFHPTKEYDFTVGSPLCNAFSKVGTKGIGSNRANIEEGLMFIGEFNRVADESKAPLRAWENVKRLEKFLPTKPTFIFRMGAQAKRGLWANFPIPISPDFRFPNRILASRMGRYYAKRKGVKALSGQEFAEIPYPIARFIANTVKTSILQAVEPTGATTT
jgi:hypothetical protein